MKINGQPWLLDKNNPYITIETQAIENNNVASLMCMDMKKWDLELVRDIFNERDQDCIISITLNELNNEDIMYWSIEKSGVYSVRSAYNLIQKQKGQ